MDTVKFSFITGRLAISELYINDKLHYNTNGYQVC